MVLKQTFLDPSKGGVNIHAYRVLHPYFVHTDPVRNTLSSHTFQSKR